MPRAKTGLADEPNKTTAVQGKKLKEAKIDAHRQGDTIWINYFEVPEKGKGLGTQEYMKFEKSLPKDIKKIRLVASDAGYGPTHEFWDRMGFDYAYPDDDNEMVKILEASVKPITKHRGKKLKEVAKVKLSHDPDDFGAYVNDGTGKLEPTTMIPVSKITIFEPDTKFQDPDNAINLKNIVKAIKAGKELPPILVRRQGLGFQVLDGHHRFMAHRLLGKKEIPARIVSKFNVKDINEASGYIPSAKEKNDPRFKTALTVDVKPDAIKKNAKAFNWKTSRAGIPPQANPNGKIAEDLMREWKSFLAEDQQELFPGYDEQHREKRLSNWLAKSWGVQNGKPQTFYHATTKDFDTFNTHGTGFASALGMAYEVERHGSFFAVDPKFAEGFIEDPNTGRVKEGGRILPVHLSIQSPIDLRDDALSRMLSDPETREEFKANDIDLNSIYNHFYELDRWELFDGPEGAEFVDNLQKLGFDGAIINEAIPNDSNAKSGQVWVAFSPNQVKSVYNRGSFSPDDPRLTRD
jgi:hypothetical protein